MASREGVLSQVLEAESVLVFQRGGSAGRHQPPGGSAPGEEGPAGACPRPSPCVSPIFAAGLGLPRGPPRSPGCRHSPFQSGLSDGSLPSKGHLGPTAAHIKPARPLSQLLLHVSVLPVFLCPPRRPTLRSLLAAVCPGPPSFPSHPNQNSGS